MILLGLILIVLGAALGLVAWLAATPTAQTIELSEFGFTRASGPLELLIIGGAAVLLVWLGWAAMSATMRRRARLRREEREHERYAELERTHADYRTETDRRFEEARLRDEDFVRREEQLQTRQAEIDLREEELARRETAWRDRPSVADVVTGRATGSVTRGGAEYVGDRADGPEARQRETGELPVDERERAAREAEVSDEHGRAARRADDE